MKFKYIKYWSNTSVMNPKTLNFCIPFAGRIEAGAGQSIPGTIGVSGEAAVSASRAVSMTTVQGDLRDPELRTDVQLLLQNKQFKCQPPCLS